MHPTLPHCMTQRQQFCQTRAVLVYQRSGKRSGVNVQAAGRFLSPVFEARARASRAVFALGSNHGRSGKRGMRPSGTMAHPAFSALCDAAIDYDQVYYLG